MAYIIADNIISPLGNTTADNLKAVLAGQSALTRHRAVELGVGDDFVSSLLPKMADNGQEGSHFEQKVLASVSAALADAGIDVASGQTLLVLSTTKGNIEQLASERPDNDIAIGHTARRIARKLGFVTDPIVVCNACISGLEALILGQRLIDQGQYDNVFVCGTDDIGRFVVSGFQSLKALSADECRPFDIERTGLNLGEAVATAVLSNRTTQNCWQLADGVVRNDAYHISAPSKQAEGQYLCLKQLLAHRQVSDIDFINLHGTATLFNDQMESVALKRAALESVPANGYKGYYGHTLGAAGVLESVLSIHSANAHTVLATRGLDELGVSGKVNVSAEKRTCQGSAFVKTLSGFGGCNAAALFTHVSNGKAVTGNNIKPRRLESVCCIELTSDKLVINGKEQDVAGEHGDHLLVHLYKKHVADYPKFYKMDPLSRLGFIASELLLKSECNIEDSNETSDRAIVFFNEHSSLAADRKYLESIVTPDAYYPSPSVFVYTLPNIVTGEIAIRHGYHGETSFYILPERNKAQMLQILTSATADQGTHSILAGWVDYCDEQHYVADLAIYKII